MGTLRLFLSLSVIVQHSQGSIFGMVGLGAWASVQMFYIISGFLMTLILNEKYVGPHQTSKFYINRFLRIFPLYYVGVVVGLAIMAYTGDLVPRRQALADLAGFGRSWSDSATRLSWDRNGCSCFACPRRRRTPAAIR